MSWVKYKIEKKQQYSGGTWVDVVPSETRDVALGTYDTEEECEGYRWVIMEEEFECIGVNKYSVEKEQLYINNTWVDSNPLVTRTGSLIESDSFDCGYIETDWRNTGVMCDGIDKYYVQTKYISDNGDTWTATTETRKGDLIESQSVDCLDPSLYKAIFYDYHGGVYFYPCDGDTILRDYPKEDGTVSQYGTIYSLIKVGNCITEVADSAFHWTGVYAVDFAPEGNLTKIGNYSFSNSSLGYKPNNYYTLIIPDSVTTIGRESFDCVHITELILGCGIETIGYNAFARPKRSRWTYRRCYDNIFTAYYSNGDKYIPNDNFCDVRYSEKWGVVLTREDVCVSGYDHTLMTDAFIGYCVKTIDENTFSGFSSLSSVTFHDSDNLFQLTTIKANAFKDCTNLQELTLISGITTIEDYAFKNCSGLTQITVNNTTPPSIGNGVFDGSTCNIYVPAASVNTYKNASGWSAYSSRIQAIP